MPKFVCTECSKEYWGWGAYHNFRKGDHFFCPECDSLLIDVKDIYTVPSKSERTIRTSAA